MTIHTPAPDTAPRYTSYPTSPHFHAGVDGAMARHWMSAMADGEPISLYVHIPFCDRLCWFCACHTRHTRRYEPVATYLDTLVQEIALVGSALPAETRISSIHLGGGSPTMLIPSDLRRLLDAIRRAFTLLPDASVSIEIDPNDMDVARLDAMADLGVTRASLGVQDFEPNVQKAINRDQSFAQTRAVVDGLRSRGISAINLDLVYGLPHQTTENVKATVGRCLELRPERFAIFGYAHVPWFKKHQTMIDETWLPGPAARLEQAVQAGRLIRRHGYVPIGIDHFALPDDSLARAAGSGRLKRNFQGYTDDQCETLIGLGPSSISRYRTGYAQNSPAMGDYVRAVAAGSLPVCRGVAITQEDRVRGWVIERLMCDFGFSVAQLLALDPRIGTVLITQAEQIAKRPDAHLMREGDRFIIPEKSRGLTRLIAARFDAHLGHGSARHSAAV